MIDAAAVITRPVVCSPRATEPRRVVRVLPLLVHARDQEDLVVHAQPEDDREHQHRHERLDRARADPEQPGAVALLEDQRHEAERGADRQQVHDRGLDRDHDRAEHDQQQQRAEEHDDADEQRQLARDDPREVLVGRGEAADLDCVRRSAARRAGTTSSRSRLSVSVVACVLRARSAGRR